MMRDILFSLRSKYLYTLLPWLFKHAPRWYQARWHAKNSPYTMALLRMDPKWVIVGTWENVTNEPKHDSTPYLDLSKPDSIIKKTFHPDGSVTVLKLPWIEIAD